MSPQPIHIELEDLDPLQKPIDFGFPEPSRAQACGKVILVGEHAVVYGAHAVAIPVPNMQLEIVLQAVQQNALQRRLSTAKPAHSENLHLVLRDALDLLNLNPFQMKIEGHSNILFGAGLGASAALCVCILRALSQFFGKKLDEFELAALANQLEKRFHGTPSGLDASTVALEKPLLFVKEQAPKPIQVKSISSEGTRYPWNFAIIDSDTRSPTITMVQQSAPYFQGSAGQERIHHFDEAAIRASEGLKTGHLDTVRQAMEKANVLLHEIGVVPRLLQDMILGAKNSGVLSAKITGAGGGGCILCLLDPRKTAETLRQLRQVFGSSKVHEVVLIGS